MSIISKNGRLFQSSIAGNMLFSSGNVPFEKFLFFCGQFYDKIKSTVWEVNGWDDNI